MPGSNQSDSCLATPAPAVAGWLELVHWDWGLWTLGPMLQGPVSEVVVGGGQEVRDTVWVFELAVAG